MQAVRWIIAGSALILCSGSQGAAQGYIDPGSGTYLFQLAAAAAFGALYAAKVYWKQLCAFLARGFGRKGSQAEALPEATSEEHASCAAAAEGSGAGSSGGV